MSYKISKELFEAVMSLSSGRITVLDNNIAYNYGHNCISINDFFFLCKEWALKQEHDLYSNKSICYIDFWSGNQTDSLFYETYVTADSEQQAVFDACEWILGQNKK